MDLDTGELLFYAGSVLVMVLFWTYYILDAVSYTHLTLPTIYSV